MNNEAMMKLHRSLYTRQADPASLPANQSAPQRLNVTPQKRQMDESVKGLQDVLYLQMSGVGMLNPSPAKASPNKSKNQSMNNSSLLNAAIKGDISSAMSAMGYVASPQPLSQNVVWGKNFRKVGTTDDLILNASFSMTHKRFKGHTTQGAAVCMVAIAMGTALCPEMQMWVTTVLDNIIVFGDELWHHTMTLSDNKCQRNPFPSQIFPHFYLFDSYITMQMATFKYTLKFLDAMDHRAELKKLILGFLNEMGEDDSRTGAVVSCQGIHVAIWRYHKYYMLFDPMEHELDGSKWTKVPGDGYAFLKRFATLDNFAAAILSNYKMKNGLVLQVFPAFLETAAQIDRVPPAGFVEKPQELAPPLKPASAMSPKDKSAFKAVDDLDKTGGGGGGGKKKQGKTPPSKPPSPPPSEPPPPEQLGIKPSVERVPKEPSRIKSEEHFAAFHDGAISVLGASTHQRDPKFTRYRDGEQSIPNAVAALCMLKIHKGKHWVRKIVDDVLKSGERLFSAVKDTCDVRECTIGQRRFSIELIRFEAMGQLQSESPQDIVDLETGLRDFLNQHTATILIGPIVVAAWLEDGYYYMFAPDPRMSDGTRPPYEKIKLIKEQGGTGIDEHFGGKAVLARFTRLKDLVTVYMDNLPGPHAKDHFYMIKADIKDYKDPMTDWFNFLSLTPNRWIIHGTFSQKDSRFDHPGKNNQCTAMAAMAFAYRSLQPMEQWTRDTVDTVLTHGDAFYQQSVEALTNEGKYIDPQLLTDELNRAYRMDDKEIDFHVDDCLVNGLWEAPSEEDVVNLRKGFDEFFETCEGGILTACRQSFGVWKMDEGYYYFDSHMRNMQGVATHHGTACIQRTVDTRTLSEAVRTNLTPDGNVLFNLSRLDVEIFLVGEDGTVIVDLKYFTHLNENMAILRGNTHHKDWDKWFINHGKIHVNCCVVAMAFDKVEPVALWGKPEMDKIMTLGNQHYKLSRKQLYDDPEARDEMDHENIRRDILVGINKLDYTSTESHTLTGLEALKDALAIMLDPSNEVYQSNMQSNPHEPTPCILLTSDLLCKGIWKDDKAIYVYDPAPRDERGDIVGRDEWTLPPPPEPEAEDAEANVESTGGDAEAGGEPAATTMPPPAMEPQQLEISEVGRPDEGGEGLEAPAADESGAEGSVKIKHSEHYWKTQELDQGKSCVLRLSRFEDLYEHLTQNTPPMKKDEMNFTLTTLKYDNETLTADVFDPEAMEKEHENQGDWHNFIEVDHLKWALRGTRNMDDELYPEENRGQQAVAMCLVALGEARLYPMDKFAPWVVDEIGTYGDRLLSGIKKSTMKLMKAKATPAEMLTDEVLAQFVHMFAYTPEHFITTEKSFLIKETKIHQDIRDKIIGHLKVADDVDHTLNLKRALRKMFDEAISEMCVVEAKGVSVAVWRSHGFYYMYDPYARSPNGARAFVGFPCITRFAELDHLVERYESNLTKDKPADFKVWPVVCTTEVAERPRSPAMEQTAIETPQPKLGGFQAVVPGKQILRSGQKLDYTKFDHGIHKHSTAIAVVALATSLFIKPETWTQLIVDDILKHGEILYLQSVEALGPRFNPWAERLDLHRVLHDFNYGNLKVNFEIRFRDERGVIYDKSNSQLQNLRQGLEKFFIKNVYGVLVIGDMAFAIWEEDREDNIIEEVTTHLYLYDPNTRGATGLPMLGGKACIMKFLNATMAADHVKSCLPPDEWTKLLYTIHPLEFLIGQQPGRKRRHKHRVYREGVPEHMGEFTATTAPGYTPKGKSPFKPNDNPQLLIHEASDPSIYLSPGSSQKKAKTSTAAADKLKLLQLPKAGSRSRNNAKTSEGAADTTTTFRRLSSPKKQWVVPRSPAPPRHDVSGYQRVPSFKSEWGSKSGGAGQKSSSEHSRLEWPASHRKPLAGMYSGIPPGAHSSTAAAAADAPDESKFMSMASERSGSGVDTISFGGQPPAYGGPRSPNAPSSFLAGHLIREEDFRPATGRMSSSPKALEAARIVHGGSPRRKSCPDKRIATIQERMIRSMADASRAAKNQRNLSAFGRHHFEKINDNVQILRARRMTQRGHELCYCYIWRIAIFREPKICNWTNHTFDSILASGEQLYVDTITARKITDCTPLTISTILREFHMREGRFELEPRQPRDTFACFEANEIADVLTRHFQSKQRYAILKFDEMYFPVAIQGGYYFLFDFNPCDHRGTFTGHPSSEESAVILRYDDLLQLGERLNTTYVNMENRNASFSIVLMNLEAAPEAFGNMNHRNQEFSLLEPQYEYPFQEAPPPAPPAVVKKKSPEAFKSLGASTSEAIQSSPNASKAGQASGSGSPKN